MKVFSNKMYPQEVKEGHSENTKKKVRCNLGVIILPQIKLTINLCIRKPSGSQRKSLRKYKEESQMQPRGYNFTTNKINIQLVYQKTFHINQK